MTKRTRRALTLAVAALAFLAAAPAAPAQTALNIAIVSRTIFFLPLWMAESKGLFKSAGIDARIEIVDNGEKINAALRDGSFQVSIASPEAIVADAYNNGGTLRLVAGNAKRLPHFIIAKPAIETLAQLKGATIGVLSFQEGTTFLLGDIAKAAGLQPADFTVTAVGGAPTRWKLLQAGKIDAGLQPFPLSYEAEAAGFNNLGPLSGLIPEYLFSGVIVDETWAEKNRATLVAFLRALRRGDRYMVEHRDEAAAVAAAELHTDPALAMRALGDAERLGILAHDLELPTPALARVFVAMQDAKVIAPDQHFDPGKFVDESYLRESR
ncbi:MAG: transporter substrate-binding protein [Rhodospirillales bacterium]|nr:transporter substrate-binding protein [Rhodospirillales bacterium]